MDNIQLKRFEKCRSAIETCIKGWENTLEDIAKIAIKENNDEVINLNYDEDLNCDYMLCMDIPCDCSEVYMADYLYFEDGKIYVDDSQYGFTTELRTLPLLNQCEIIERAIKIVNKK